MSSVAGERAVGFRRVLRQPEFAAVLVAKVLSDWGDHVARVAIASLMLVASGSVAMSAATFAVSWLPSIFGQALLGPYADRVPRRLLLITCDGTRAGLVLVLTGAVVLDLPLLVVLGVLFLVELVGSPFYAANTALLTEVFADPRQFMTANALLRLVGQLNQVVGLAAGGLVVALMGVRGALVLDAATFVASGLLLLVAVRPRAAAAAGGVPGLADLWQDVRLGIAQLHQDVPLRSLMLLAWTMTVVFVAPEAVALAYAQVQGESPRVGGLLLAAPAAGTVVGVLTVSRWAWTRQVRRLLPLAAGAGVPLLLVGLEPSWPTAALLFALSGVCGAFMIPLLGTFTVLTPSALTGRLNGLAGAGFSLATVVAYLFVGIVADLTSPAFAVTLGGALGCLALAYLYPSWPRREIREAAGSAFSRPG